MSEMAKKPMKGGHLVDFYQITQNFPKQGLVDIFPDFIIGRSNDIMIRAKSFYAIWDDEKKLWSTDDYDVQRIVDNDLKTYFENNKDNFPGSRVHVKYLRNFSNKTWTDYQYYLKNSPDNSHQLDENLTFLNTKVKKTDYVSRVLPYPLEEGSIAAYDELIGTLYDPEERAKLEWAVGAIIAGDAKNIQKFIVLYGEQGSGKSTFLNIVQKLFDGYYTTFEAKALTSSSNAFSTEVFRANPLVAIQHDGDLSRIEDNTKLNSIISHEDMTMNEKYKPSYMSKINAFLFMGTNKPVRITDAKSGIIRRLIDVKPSLNKVPNKKYHTLMAQIDFELGAIAYHCLQVYKKMGQNYYSSYRPLDMIFQTDVFFNFVEDNYYIFKEQNGISLSQAYDIYKAYCEEALVEFKLPKHKFREELKSYFETFSDVSRVDGKQIRSYYSGFITDRFISTNNKTLPEEKVIGLVLDSEKSILDELLQDCLAQYATVKENPEKKWDKVKTKLRNINTHEIHYVRPPLQHIVIDFDLKDSEGNKSLDLNLEKASGWPITYAEVSKSGAGIHLHYIYEGDVSKLSRVYEDEIEIKVFTGKSSLRRKFTKCNNSPIATINSGLPLKGETMVNLETVKSEQSLRNLILRNLNKEFHPGTKSSIDFIYKILDDAFKSKIPYDVTDMRPRILAFANNSTNQAEYCIKLVNKMQFASEETSVSKDGYENEELIFFDVEVFPNLFVVVWKATDKQKITLINPPASAIEELLKFRLVGFNCRRYDNHIVYARYIGYTNEQLFNLSQKIINNSRNGMFGEAYNISYTDVYDFASATNKKSLKKFEIELGMHHNELGLPWDQPVPEELWEKVGKYCGDDVDATEGTFYHLAGDWVARQILAELSGLTVNDTTNQHSIKIIFGNNKNPQNQLVYTDLSEMFPGYIFENGKSTYRGEITGEGGYVYAEPGMYTNVALLDIASMHPTSIEELNYFGPYTKIFSDIKAARIAIKHEDFSLLEILLDGRLIPFIKRALNGEFTLKSLSDALKTVLNSVYGLSAAKFDNPCRDARNKDNIVAKRGALFMVDLKHAVQEQGFTVAHIKTDSIKIPDATPEIIDFVFEFGKKYGYTFEHEDTYERLCLVNDAVYIARDKNSEWVATGAQFAQPYVFKTLFSHEPIVFNDFCEVKSVVGSALYLDMNENLSEGGHNYVFVGKIGQFTPIKSGCNGGLLMRSKEDKYYAATGTKGYRWLESEMVRELNKEGDIDKQYYINLVDSAVKDISEYGDFEWFVSDSKDPPPKQKTPPGFDETPPPWLAPCGKDKECIDCIEENNCQSTLVPF